MPRRSMYHYYVVVWPKGEVIAHFHLLKEAEAFARQQPVVTTIERESKKD